MKLLINGCYDLETVQSTKSLGNVQLAFDLRATGLNLVSFNELKKILEQVYDQRIFLIFGNDKKETIISYLDILNEDKERITLIFRDQKDDSFFAQIYYPFFWTYHPDEIWHWRLNSPLIRGVILPVKWKDFYSNEPLFWQVIEEKNLEVYLHTSTFAEAEKISKDPNIRLSIDINPEVETKYRAIDQDKLKNLRIWRKLNEDSPL